MSSKIRLMDFRRDSEFSCHSSKINILERVLMLYFGSQQRGCHVKILFPQLKNVRKRSWYVIYFFLKIMLSYLIIVYLSQWEDFICKGNECNYSSFFISNFEISN